MVERSGDELMLEKWAEEYQNDPEYIAEGLAVDVTNEAIQLLERQGHNQSWLAQQMGISRQSVSRIFSAAPNLTLLSIARLAVALGATPKILLDSDSWFIRRLDANSGYEDVVTDIAMQQSPYRTSNAQDALSTLDEHRGGPFTNAAA